MATPNYGYEKRQRELAKKQKKEEKLRAKSARRQGADDAPAQDDPSESPQDGGAEGTTGSHPVA